MDWIAALVRLYPRAYRERHGAELASAMRACAARERNGGASRLGIAVQLAADAAASAFLVRRDLRRLAARASQFTPRASGDPLMQSLVYDLRYALRHLVRAPLFSALIVATLALAIGANTAIFSVVNGVLLRALPYHEPDRLVVLYEGVVPGQPPFGFSAPDYAGFRDRAGSFDGLEAFRSVEYELSGVDQPERISGARISASLFAVLGTPLPLGRAFTAEEDAGQQPVAILSNGLWRRKFGADRAIVGKSLTLDRRAYTVVGVTPPYLTFPNRGPSMNNVPADVYVPISFSAAELGAFGMMYNNTVLGRLKPGVTPAQAWAESDALGKRLVAELYPAELRELGGSITIPVVPLLDDVIGGIRRILVVLLAAVGVVLLIACADIACLMLTRAAARGREMAIRTALGAGRGRLMRLVLIETAVLAALGGAFGLALAWWAAQALLGAAPAAVPRASEVTFDVRVLAFTFAVAAVAAFACGLFPAFESSRRDSGTALKEGGRSGTESVRQRRIFAGLVTAQFACAVVLRSEEHTSELQSLRHLVCRLLLEKKKKIH